MEEIWKMSPRKNILNCLKHATRTRTTENVVCLFTGTNRHLRHLAASPDLLIECTCCGEGLLEIKCPYSIANECPTIENLPYLVTTNDKMVLEKKTPILCSDSNL